MTLADARDNREDAVWSKALAAFDDLGLGSNVPEHVRDGAAGIAASTPATDVQRVTDVLIVAEYRSAQAGMTVWLTVIDLRYLL